jgi:hypothetical protein
MLRKQSALTLFLNKRAFREVIMPLTGRYDFRKTLSGKLVLILEEDVTALSPLRRGRTRRRWRKATVMDLAATELRPLMDLRSKPNYHVPLHSVAGTSTFVQAAVAAETESPRISTH